jgi:hypothetical protein
MESVKTIQNALINKFSHTTFLLAFIFCGAIVGENVSLSLVVSSFGSSIISKLYLVNGLLLFSLPILFFNRIDNVDRGRLLSKLLIICSSILFGILLLIIIAQEFKVEKLSWILVVLYPFSYLSKTILFLTFWTFANDVFPTGEAKKKFPIIAAWGIGGGICGSSIAFFLIKVFPTFMLIALWATSFLVAWFFSGNINNRFEKQLMTHEDFRKKALFDKKPSGSRHPSFILLLLMASQYFLVFLAIFSLDYIFWNRSQSWFPTSEKIASFHFMFYLIHASVTVIGLRLLLPKTIAGIGFTKIFYFLPLTLVAGGLFIVVLTLLFPDRRLFVAFTAVQFLRYVVFENAYAPIYQMYFAAIEKEKRGRAKTLIEGLVKPGAILSCGIILLLLNNNTVVILTIAIVCSAFALINAYYIRRMYAMALIPTTYKHVEPQLVINEFVGCSDKATMSIISQYADSSDVDMRLLAVKLLASAGTQQAFDEIMRLYKTEDIQSVKELIARSISGFYNYSSKKNFEEMLSETNQRIRANTLYSLNRMRCNWKRHLRPLVRKLLFESSVRVQIEAACYLWENGDQHDRINTADFVKSLLNNPNPNRQSAGIYLTSIILQPDWEVELLEKLHSPHVQVYRKCIEVLFGAEDLSLHLRVLSIIESLDRDRITIAGDVIEKRGNSLWNTIIEFLPLATNRRMKYELIRCMRLLSDSIRSSGKSLQLSDDTAAAITAWINKELEVVYRDSVFWYNCREMIKNHVNTSVLDSALRENFTRLCEWTVNAMVLLDKKGVMTWRHNDIDIKEKSQRLDLIEIIEGTSYQKIGGLILPILKMDSWEYLAEIGKNQFRFNDSIGVNGLIYFFKLDNKWISLCALYTISEISQILWTAELKELINNMEKSSDDALVPSSTEILQQNLVLPGRSYALELLERVLFLKSTPLFKNVSSEKLLKLAEIACPVDYEPDEVISKQGDIAEHLYIVKTGSLKVLKQDGDKLVNVSVINVGETYGEIGLFNQAPRSASAVAIEKCSLLIIKRAQLKKMLIEVPDIAFNLLGVLSDRLRKSGEEYIHMMHSLTSASSSNVFENFETDNSGTLI